jgi:hypothetical protein
LAPGTLPEGDRLGVEGVLVDGVEGMVPRFSLEPGRVLGLGEAPMPLLPIVPVPELLIMPVSELLIMPVPGWVELRVPAPTTPPLELELVPMPPAGWAQAAPPARERAKAAVVRRDFVIGRSYVLAGFYGFDCIWRGQAEGRLMLADI